MFVSKYSASGNDFIIFHIFKKQDFSQLAKRLCHRHFGIGADGLIAILPHVKYDFEWDFYNQDGSSATMCGNGARAAVQYMNDNALIKNKQDISFLTLSGDYKASIIKNEIQIEFQETKDIQSVFEYGKEWFLIDTGVKHMILFDKSLSIFDIDKLKKLRNKHNANISLATIKDENIHIKTYERGVEDITLACGTAIVGAFMIALKQKFINNTAIAIPPSKHKICLQKINNKILFKGIVQKICDSIITI